MLKRVFTTIALVGTLLISALAPSVAAENVQVIPASLNAVQNMTPVPGHKAAPSITQQLEELKNPQLAQVMVGNICRLGFYFCYLPFPAPVGMGCGCPWGQGFVSNF